MFRRQAQQLGLRLVAFYWHRIVVGVVVYCLRHWHAAHLDVDQAAIFKALNKADEFITQLFVHRSREHAEDIHNQQHIVVSARRNHQRLALNTPIPAHLILPRPAKQHPHLAGSHLGITFVGIQI